MVQRIVRYLCIPLDLDNVITIRNNSQISLSLFLSTNNNHMVFTSITNREVLVKCNALPFKHGTSHQSDLMQLPSKAVRTVRMPCPVPQSWEPESSNLSVFDYDSETVNTNNQTQLVRHSQCVSPKRLNLYVVHSSSFGQLFQMLPMPPSPGLHFNKVILVPLFLNILYSLTWSFLCFQRTYLGFSLVKIQYSHSGMDVIRHETRSRMANPDSICVLLSQVDTQEMDIESQAITATSTSTHEEFFFSINNGNNRPSGIQLSQLFYSRKKNFDYLKH